MANYKEIQGFPIQNLSSDPVPYAQELINNPYAGVWSSGGALPQANRSMGLFGTYTSAVAAGGAVPTPSNLEADSYDGTSWSEIAELSSAKNEAQGFGSSGSSGYIVKDTTENWNGSAWTEVNDLNTARGLAGASGTSSAGLVAGGEAGSGNAVESWDGTSWTELSEINTGRAGPAMSGIQTSSILMGGVGFPGGSELNNVETWNGSSWTEGNNLNEARQRLGGAGKTVSTALVFGGQPGTPAPTTVSAKTESYDGTSFTEVNDLATARRSVGIGSGGTGTNALAVGGLTPTITTATEEWAFSGLPPSTPAAGYSDAIVGQMYYNSTTGQFKAIKSGFLTGTWASGGSLNNGRYRMIGGAGTYNAGTIFAGYNPVTNHVESYDGTSWTEIANYPASLGDVASCGASQTAALSIGGNPGKVSTVNEFDGSSFSAGGSLPSGVARSQLFGTQTAAVSVGGATPANPSYDDRTLHYDGSTWTTSGDFPQGIANGGSCGTQTAGFSFGGYTPSASTQSAFYNGSAWTSGPALNIAKNEVGFSTRGSQTAAFICAGTPSETETELFDGTSWSEGNDLSNAQNSGASSGDLQNAFYAGSSSSPNTETEEWTQAEFTINSLTTS